MQGALIIFALITFACAQSPVPPGGCCFYADKDYKNEVACTSSTFNISDITFDSKATFQGIQSFFCEDGWSAAIIFKGEAQELVDCGDTVPETTVPIPTDSVTIGPCLQRRCCFYSGKNKDGNEYCMYAGASVDAELKNAQSELFLVGECLQDWKAEVTGKNGKINIDCGVTMDLDGKTSFDKITLTPCTAPKAFGESVENTLGDAAFVDTFQDQAVADQAVVDQAVADQAVADQAVVDQAVADQAVVDQAVVDVAVVDQAVADQAVADVAVVEDSLLVDNFAADQAAADLAVADENVDMFSEDLLLADASLDQAVADDTSFAVADVAVAEDALLAFDHGDESAFVADQAVVDQAVIDQAVADQAIIDQAVADQAVIDQAVIDQAFADQAFADQAVIDQAVADFASADLFVGDYNDQAVMDAFDQQFADQQFADQAVGDNFDQVFGDQAFDAAVQDSAVTMNSSANSVFVTLAVVVASLVALLF